MFLVPIWTILCTKSNAFGPVQGPKPRNGPKTRFRGRGPSKMSFWTKKVFYKFFRLGDDLDGLTSDPRSRTPQPHRPPNGQKGPKMGQPRLGTPKNRSKPPQKRTQKTLKNSPPSPRYGHGTVLAQLRARPDFWLKTARKSENGSYLGLGVSLAGGTSTTR